MISTTTPIRYPEGHLANRRDQNIGRGAVKGTPLAGSTSTSAAPQAT